jgi:hypothetical protein
VKNLKLYGLALVVSGLLVGGAFRAADGDSDKPKYSIKQVMSQAHKPSSRNMPTLADKVINGTASKDEQAKLLDLYTAMTVNKPPKGEAEAWKDKTAAVTAAIQEVIDGKEDGGVDLRKALNCKACHTSHRGR